jgi:hypothetical protein
MYRGLLTALGGSVPSRGGTTGEQRDREGYWNELFERRCDPISGRWIVNIRRCTREGADKARETMTMTLGAAGSTKQSRRLHRGRGLDSVKSLVLCGPQVIAVLSCGASSETLCPFIPRRSSRSLFQLTGFIRRTVSELYSCCTQ